MSKPGDPECRRRRDQKMNDCISAAALNKPEQACSLFGFIQKDTRKAAAKLIAGSLNALCSLEIGQRMFSS